MRALNIVIVSLPKRGSLVLLGCFTFALFVSACAGTKAAVPTATPSPGPQAIDTGNIVLQTSLKTTYYTVQGTTTAAIFNSIEANGPKDAQGTRGSGITSVVWGYKWSGSEQPDGSCSIGSMTIQADMTVTLPQHAGESTLSDSIRQHWDTYAAGVATHEQHHVDIYIQGASDIKDKMQGLGVMSSCDTLDGQIKTIWSNEQARIDGLQQAFHAQENARLAAEREPIQSQVTANRARLQELQDQIDALDSETSQLAKDIGDLRTQEDSIDAQINQILVAFPGAKPDTVQARLQSLVQQSNNLLSQDNAKVDQHNNSLTQRAALAAQHDALVQTTNGLVDQYNWTR